MKYTVEQLGVMPENTLNGTLRRLVYGDDKDVIRLGIDFCNDASATMPLADEHIALMRKLSGGGWRIESTPTGCYCWAFNDTKLLRAIVVVLILVLQERDA